MAHCRSDLVCEFCELSFRIAAFLDVEVRTTVDGLDDDLFPAFPGEQDIGNRPIVPADLDKELNAVHTGHLVIGNNGIKLLVFQKF